MTEDAQVAVVDHGAQSALDLGGVDTGAAFAQAERLVQRMAERCTGPQYISKISGRPYPKVEWWTTVGMVLGLFPREESRVRLDREGEIAYEAVVGVYRGDQVVTRASAICSNTEKMWRNRDENAIASMAVTRATGKAYRLGLSGLAVMAGLEATPAEEMPHDEAPQRPRKPRNVSPQQQSPPAEDAKEAAREKALAPFRELFSQYDSIVDEQDTAQLMDELKGKDSRARSDLLMDWKERLAARQDVLDGKVREIDTETKEMDFATDDDDS